MITHKPAVMTDPIHKLLYYPDGLVTSSTMYSTSSVMIASNAQMR